MAHFHSPRIVTDGLVFYYDTANALKSYKGEPTVNYVPGTYDYSLYAYVSGPVTAIATNEERKEVAVKRYTITNAVNTARAAIYPNTNTTDYFTFSFKWKYNGTVTASPSMGITASKGNPEGGANNNSIGYERANTVAIGNGWYLTTYTFRFSSNPTGRCMLTFGINTGSNTGYVGETFDVYEAQFEAKAHKTQYVNGTRSSTAALLDMVGGTTINLANVSFDDNAQMTFDGTNDYIQASEYTIPATGPFTVEFVYRISTVGGRGGLFERNPNSPYNGMSLGQGGAGNWAFNISDTFNGTLLSAAFTYPTQNVWYHDVGVFNGSNTVQSYRNGVLVNTTTAGTVGNIDTQGTRDKLLVMKRDNNSSTVGGDVALVKVYNRALTAAEVTQNYQAVKSRFGI